MTYAEQLLRERLYLEAMRLHVPPAEAVQYVEQGVAVILGERASNGRS